MLVYQRVHHIMDFLASDLGRPWRQLASRSGASVRAALRGVAAEAVDQTFFFCDGSCKKNDIYNIYKWDLMGFNGDLMGSNGIYWDIPSGK